MWKLLGGTLGNNRNILHFKSGKQHDFRYGTVMVLAVILFIRYLFGAPKSTTQALWEEDLQWYPGTVRQASGFGGVGVSGFRV